jgi:hypothetical protein
MVGSFSLRKLAISGGTATGKVRPNLSDRSVSFADMGADPHAVLLFGPHDFASEFYRITSNFQRLFCAFATPEGGDIDRSVTGVGPDSIDFMALGILTTPGATSWEPPRTCS